jgi:ferredoxin-NADP reductase
MEVPQELEAVVERLEDVADGVRAITLAPADGGDLPAWEPGAHVDLLLPGGITRQYSLCGDPADRDRWRVAVLREPESRGGSSYVHEQLQEGARLAVVGPRNAFELVDAGRYVFVAGGIGITPIIPMIRRVAERGGDWQLTYGGRTRASMAFAEELAAAHPGRVSIAPQDVHGLLDLPAVIGAPDDDAVVYCCGPGPLIDAVEAFCAGWPRGALHVERFRPADGALDGAMSSFDVVIASSGERITVGEEESIVDALDRVGVFIPTSCREGTCGTCETVVLEGVPDHRDSVLSEEEREENELMMLCCSRALTPELVLDL